jgi:hypothetical protein
MNTSDLSELEKRKAKLIAGMLDYMQSEDDDDDFDPGYTKADVKKCDGILTEFTDSLHDLAGGVPESKILNCVKQVVLELNKLNEDAGGSLIETDQREDLCDYILFAARQSGLKRNDDVTEEWRKW